MNRKYSRNHYAAGGKKSNSVMKQVGGRLIHLVCRRIIGVIGKRRIGCVSSQSEASALFLAPVLQGTFSTVGTPPGAPTGRGTDEGGQGVGGADLEAAAALAALPPGVVGDEEVPRELGGREGGRPWHIRPPPPSPVLRHPDSCVSVGTPLKPGATGFRVACQKKTWFRGAWGC